MKIIAISGWKRSGKDSVAELLTNNYNFRRISFADPLKEMVALQYNLPIRYMYDQELKEKPLEDFPVLATDEFGKHIHTLLKDEFKTIEGTDKLFWTPRALLILEGSIKRSVNSNYWIQQAIRNIKTSKEPTNFVIPDLRYTNEAKQLAKAFGKDLTLIRINRFDSVDTNDPSERDLDNYSFDYVIDNKSTLEDFLNKSKVIIEGVLNV